MFSPTRAFPTPVLPAASLGGSLNRMSYGAFLRISTSSFHRTINRWRVETLGFPPRDLLESDLELRGDTVSILVGCSPLVVLPTAYEDTSTTISDNTLIDNASGNC